MGLRDPKLTWFLTYPQTKDTPETLLSNLSDVDEIREYVIAQELHQDGNTHLHAYVKFKKGVILKDAPVSFNVLSKTGNYQPTRSCKAVILYCTKGGAYLSNIDIDKYKAKKGKVTSETLRTYTAIEALDGGIVGINSLKAYEHARSLAIDPKERKGVCGIWIYGPSGTGKSHHARMSNPDDLYVKAQNKWWDGYVGQSTVLLEDYDTDALGHHLKLWTDKWSHTGEIKGGAVSLCHDTFIITSNYSIAQLFPNTQHKDNTVLRQALERRFTEIYLGKKTDTLDLSKPTPEGPFSHGFDPGP